MVCAAPPLLVAAADEGDYSVGRQLRHMPLVGGRTPAQEWWGQIKGSPSRSSFTFNEELKLKCRDGGQEIPVRDFPLSISPTTYRQIFLSKESCSQASFGEWSHDRYTEHWKQLRRLLPDHIGDVIGDVSRKPSCAVVGNSGNLLHSSCGPLIDRHHTVIRLNKGPTKGFERSVGSKMTYRFMNKRQFRVYANDGRIHNHWEAVPDDRRGVVVVSRSPPDMMLEDIRAAVASAKRKHKPLRFTAMSMRMFSYANDVMTVYRKCQQLRGGSTGSFKSATSGLMAAMIALHLCDHVSVFGVGEGPPQPPQPHHRGSATVTPYQYFAKARPWASREAPNANHNMTLEAALLGALADAGLLSHCTAAGGCRGRGLPFNEL